MTKKEIIAVKVEEKIKKRLEHLGLKKREKAEAIRRGIEIALNILEGKTGNLLQAIYKLADLVIDYIKLKENEEFAERVLKILRETPCDYYHDGSLGESRSKIKVWAILPNGETWELAGRGGRSSNYAYEQEEYWDFGDLPEEFSDLPILAQLSYIYKEISKGQPFKVKAEYEFLNDWPGQRYVKEKWTLEFTFPPKFEESKEKKKLLGVQEASSNFAPP